MIWAVLIAAVAGLAFWKRQEVKKGAEKATEMGAEGYKAARAKMGGAAEEEAIDLTAEAAGAAADAAEDAADEAADAATDEAEAEADAKADS